MLFDKSVTFFSNYIIAFFELYIIINIIGIDNLKKLSNNITNYRIPDYIIFSLKYVCPYVLITFSVISFIKIFLSSSFFDDEIFSDSFISKIIAILIVYIPASVALYTYYRNKNKFHYTNLKEVDFYNLDE